LTPTSGSQIPIAYCPGNEVETYGYPFFIKKGVGVETDFILLEIHLYHMTSDEKAVMGELLRIACIEDLEALGYPTDDRGVFIVGEIGEHWFRRAPFGKG